MITYIYTLVDPETDKVRYVGKTNVKPQNRYNQHIYQWKRSIRLTKVNSWIKHLSLKDKKPVCNITKEGVVLFEFKSVTEAARFFKIEPTHITRVCKGKSKSGLTKGHYFKYL